MAWILVLSGGSISIESDDVDSVVDQAKADQRYVELEKAIEAAGFYFVAGTAVNASDDDLAVFMLGKDLHSERYLDRGEFCTVDGQLAPEARLQADQFLDELDSLLESLGHTTERASGIVIHHFD